MMNIENCYRAFWKRKSFHLFRGVGNEKISEKELAAISDAYAGFESLYPEIRTAIRIVPSKSIPSKRDAEYCILLYSEKKENYLLNAGFIGEQLDLWLVDHHIGSLWYGIGKPDERNYDGLEYVIMFAIRKVSDESKYRGNMQKAARKPLSEVWRGEDYGVADIARFAPSACNSQPWYVESKDNTLTVFRRGNPGKLGIMPAAAASYFNRIDMGIYLCVLEICLLEKGMDFTRMLYTDEGSKAEYTKIAELVLRNAPREAGLDE